MKERYYLITETVCWLHPCHWIPTTAELAPSWVWSLQCASNHANGQTDKQTNKHTDRQIQTLTICMFSLIDCTETRKSETWANSVECWPTNKTDNRPQTMISTIIFFFLWNNLLPKMTNLDLQVPPCCIRCHTHSKSIHSCYTTRSVLPPMHYLQVQGCETTFQLIRDKLTLTLNSSSSC